MQEHSLLSTAKPSPSAASPHSDFPRSDRYSHVAPASYAQAETQTHGLLLIPSAVVLEADAQHVQHVGCGTDTAAQCSDVCPAARILPSGIDGQDHDAYGPMGGCVEVCRYSAAHALATRAFLSVGPIRSQVFSWPLL